ncbi:hypothetical protein BC828DRAFT_382085, partial [Blastocladiella britannica]
MFPSQFQGSFVPQPLPPPPNTNNNQAGTGSPAPPTGDFQFAFPVTLDRSEFQARFQTFQNNINSHPGACAPLPQPPVFMPFQQYAPDPQGACEQVKWRTTGAAAAAPSPYVWDPVLPGQKFSFSPTRQTVPLQQPLNYYQQHPYRQITRQTGPFGPEEDTTSIGSTLIAHSMYHDHPYPQAQAAVQQQEQLLAFGRHDAEAVAAQARENARMEAEQEADRVWHAQQAAELAHLHQQQQQQQQQQAATTFTPKATRQFADQRATLKKPIKRTHSNDDEGMVVDAKPAPALEPTSFVGRLMRKLKPRKVDGTGFGMSKWDSTQVYGTLPTVWAIFSVHNTIDSKLAQERIRTAVQVECRDQKIPVPVFVTEQVETHRGTNSKFRLLSFKKDGAPRPVPVSSSTAQGAATTEKVVGVMFETSAREMWAKARKRPDQERYPLMMDIFGTGLPSDEVLGVEKGMWATLASHRVLIPRCIHGLFHSIIVDRVSKTQGLYRTDVGQSWEYNQVQRFFVQQYGMLEHHWYNGHLGASSTNEMICHPYEMATLWKRFLRANRVFGPEYYASFEVIAKVAADPLSQTAGDDGHIAFPDFVANAVRLMVYTLDEAAMGLLILALQSMHITAKNAPKNEGTGEQITEPEMRAALAMIFGSNLIETPISFNAAYVPTTITQVLLSRHISYFFDFKLPNFDATSIYQERIF